MRSEKLLAPPALMVAVLLCTSGCNSGRNQLLADIQSPRPEERALAVRKLSAQNHADDLVLFTHAAKDVSFLVRQEAATALGRSQDVRVVDLLGELLEDPDEVVQTKAALALAELKGDKAKAYLTLQYSRRGTSTRSAIVQGLKSAGVPNAMASVVAAEARAIWQRDTLALSDGSPPERVGAAEDLGKSGRPEATGVLQRLTKDSQVILAAAAVRGLGQTGDPRMASPIAELLEENVPELREAALQALKQLRSPEALEPLHAVALEKSPASAQATEALIALPRSSAVDAVLCSLAVEGSEPVATSAGLEMRGRGGCPPDILERKLNKAGSGARRGERVTQESQAAGLVAVDALGTTARAALPWVAPLASEKDARLRRLAVQALGELGDDASAPAVEKAFAVELAIVRPLRDKWVASALPKTFAPGYDPGLALPGDPTSVKQSELAKRLAALDDERRKASGKIFPLEKAPSELVDDVQDDQLRGLAAAALALGRVHAPGALEKLKALSEDPSALLRRSALVGMASLGAPGIALAKAGLLDPDRTVQGAVAAALASQGEPGLLALLEVLPKLAGDRMPFLEALAQRPLPGAFSAPLQQMVQQGGVEGAAAAGLLGDMKAMDAAPTLIKALEDRTCVGRRSILSALGRIGDPKATEVVAHDLFDESPDVRAAAADALAHLGGSAPTEALEALRGDYYRKVRESAVAALARGGPTGAAVGQTR